MALFFQACGRFLTPQKRVGRARKGNNDDAHTYTYLYNTHVHTRARTGVRCVLTLNGEAGPPYKYGNFENRVSPDQVSTGSFFLLSLSLSLSLSLPLFKARVVVASSFFLFLLFHPFANFSQLNSCSFERRPAYCQR